MDSRDSVIYEEVCWSKSPRWDDTVVYYTLAWYMGMCLVVRGVHDLE